LTHKFQLSIFVLQICQNVFGPAHGECSGCGHAGSGLCGRGIALIVAFSVRTVGGTLIPEVRSNLGYALSGAAGYQDSSPQILEACKTLGLHMTSFDRQKEPKEVKEREGSTLEWGTSLALQGVQEIPDLVDDNGDVGKEPMIRILGKNPMEVVEKINRIKQNLTNYL
jgi:predicted fused transcriptional regulator/phosphomethylpyrimidine kinase